MDVSQLTACWIFLHALWMSADFFYPDQARHFVTSDQSISLFVCLFVLLLYVPSQQLWSRRDVQFT